MDRHTEVQLANLIRTQRWSCLATLHGGEPYSSFVAYVPENDFSAFLIHISRLAPHTQNLLMDARAALAITEQDLGSDDPQTLARVSLQGSVIELERDSPAYQQARKHYLQRLPDAAQLFSFSDFILFRFVPTHARFVAGFARTWDISPQHLQSIAISNTTGRN